MDYAHNQVRLALADATDIAMVSGQFDAVVPGQVVVLSGQNLYAISRTGYVTGIGHLAGVPQSSGPGTVAVRPDAGAWLYTLVNPNNWSTEIRLGTAAGDSVLETVASPDGGDFYQPFTWNASGVYLVKQGTGLGGAGAFLEYHFPLARLDIASGRITTVSPTCLAEQVLDDGTMLCRNGTGGLDVRSPSGATHTIQIATASSGLDGVFARLTTSPDQTRVIAVRDASKDPVVNYQMATAPLTASSATVFGPVDYQPDTWLPDGRVVADHVCVDASFGGGPCNPSLDGTYYFSADGTSRTLFYKLAGGSYVVANI